MLLCTDEIVIDDLLIAGLGLGVGRIVAGFVCGRDRLRASDDLAGGQLGLFQIGQYILFEGFLVVFLVAVIHDGFGAVVRGEKRVPLKGNRVSCFFAGIEDLADRRVAQITKEKRFGR